MESLLLLYISKKADIQKRLSEFELAKYGSDNQIFSELAFCICTPQTRAKSANTAIKNLVETNILFEGNEQQISEILAKNGVRFHKNKAKYIVQAREIFTKNNKLKIKSMLNTEDVKGLRNWLAKNILGINMKEASHFLRNIGYGKDLAILDRHVLRKLKELNIIKEIPKHISKSTYLELEQKLAFLAQKLNISLAELDMTLWSEHGSLPIAELR
ncbi:MAG: N-glycosylase/DNA lyase [Candidatus Nanoarchaeia archaeon]